MTLVYYHSSYFGPLYMQAWRVAWLQRGALAVALLQRVCHCCSLFLSSHGWICGWRSKVERQRLSSTEWKQSHEAEELLYNTANWHLLEGEMSSLNQCTVVTEFPVIWQFEYICISMLCAFWLYKLTNLYVTVLPHWMSTLTDCIKVIVCIILSFV